MSTLRRVRLAPVLSGAVAAVAFADGAWRRHIGAALLARWSSTATTVLTRPWRLATSVFITRDPKMVLGACLILLLAIGVTELWIGWRRALVAAVAGTVLGTVVIDIVLLAARAAGSTAAAGAAATPDYGASAMSAGAIGALAGAFRWPASLVLGALMLNGVALHHALPDWEHLVAFTTGFLLARRWRVKEVRAA
jgi:hypothetical protein